MRSNKGKLILGGLVVYLLSAALTYGILAKSKTGSIFTSPLPDGAAPGAQNTNRKPVVEITGNATEACPLNGALYTKVEKISGKPAGP